VINKQNNIQEFELSALAKSGVYIVNMRDIISADSHDTSEPHRDDHYLFMLATQGRYVLNLDFNNVIIDSPALLMILPGQVHFMVEMDEPQGWILNFDPAILNTDLQQIFENGLITHMSLKDEFEFQKQLSDLLIIIENLQSSVNDVYASKSIHALLVGISGIIAGKLLKHSSEQRATEGRRFDLKLSFITLLKKRYKEWKEPAQYANALSVSVAHLNFCVKKTTGIPLSHHIQQHSILEAKRLLYYTNLNVKEIGYQIGYNDPVYFGKLFRKITGFTPLQFRQKFQKS
jgi:AraC family transcriptional activator of pobA